MPRKSQMKAMAGDSALTAKVIIDGEIGSSWWDDAGNTSRRLIQQIEALGEVDLIEIDINSPGGAVTDGLAIANYLRSHPAAVTVNVVGQASSIASVIACAADEVRMGVGAFMFLHQASSCFCGNADAAAALARDLSTIDDGILDFYVSKAGEEKRAEIEDLVKGADGNGTLLHAQQCVELGLADSMTAVKAAASFIDLAETLSAARSDKEEPADDVEEADDEVLPLKAVADELDVPVQEIPADPSELVAMIRDRASISLEFLAARHPDLVASIQANGSEHVRGTAIAAERERVTSIVRAAVVAKQFDAVEKLVSEAWEADKAADFLIAAAASADEQINASHSPEGGHQAALDIRSIYARRKLKTKE